MGRRGKIMKPALAAFAGLMLLSSPLAAMTDEAARKLAREVYEELVTQRSVDGLGTTPALVEKLAWRFVAGGFDAMDVHMLIGPRPGVGNLVVRLKGRETGKKPILLMAHIDVVDALASDWTMDPFTLNEVNGEFIGRGVADNKAGAAHLITTLLRFREEGYVPDRDLVIVLTGDEETGGDGIKFLLKDHRELVEAEFALNSDAGGGNLRNGTGESYVLQTSEKMYLTFLLEAKNPGGHSSLPRPKNAIYQLTRALNRISNYKFEPAFNETTRQLFAELAKLDNGGHARDLRSLASSRPSRRAIRRLSKDVWFNAMIRTTCVATRLAAGHADNALPQTATATVNCRIMPGIPADRVEARLRRVVDDSEITIRRESEPVPSPPSPLRSDVVDAVRRAIHQRYPGIPVIPSMSTGATDGLYVRNAGIPTYGINALFGNEAGANAHGMNEHVLVDQFFAGLEHWNSILKTLSGGTP